MPAKRVTKITSFLLMVMVFAVSVFGQCEETHAVDKSWDNHSQRSCPDMMAAADHCPSCPGEGDAHDGNCASACYCACHLPITSHTLQIGHAPAIDELSVFEAFSAPPEVYLTKFIPPQNLA